MQINVLEYLENTVSSMSEKVVFFGGQNNLSITFSDVYKFARTGGSLLCGRVKMCEPVVVIASKSVYTPVLYLSVLYAGAYYVPVGSELPAPYIKSVMNITNAKVILTDGSCPEMIASLDFNGIVITLSDILSHDKIDDAELAVRKRKHCDTNPMYVIFTSGSTGTPKGVVTPHRAVIDYIDVFIKTFGFDSSDILGNQAPLDYVAGIRDIYIPLATGASSLLITKQLFSTPKLLFDFLNQNRVTTLCWVAPALSILAEMGALSENILPSVKKVFFTGSVMQAKFLRMWQEALSSAVFVNHYGPTEITASCTYFTCGKIESDNYMIPIGIPFDNTEILLLDDIGKPVNDGELGEIYVRGTCLASGYLRNPEKTKEAFIQNPLHSDYTDIVYKTGDLALYLPDGNLEFHGRRDYQIKHMGHRIELSQIEIYAALFPGVSECCCLYDEEKQMIWMFYTGGVSSRDLLIYLRESLPSYMAPRKFVQLDDFPRTVSGKIDIKKLKENW